MNKNIRDLPSLRNVHIDEMYQKGAKLPEIVKSIQYEQIFYNIYDGFFDKIRKIRLREKECDIKIADFIVKNYKKHHLFYDAGHPTNKIIREFGKQICSILKIPYDEKITMSTFLDAGEVFIYGCVKKELGMTFVQDYIRCHNTNNTLFDAPLSLIEYVKEYLLWNFGKTL